MLVICVSMIIYISEANARANSNSTIPVTSEFIDIDIQPSKFRC